MITPRFVLPIVVTLALLAPVRAERLLDKAKLHAIDTAVEKAIEEERLPGGVVWVEHGGAIYSKAYGNRALVPVEEEMTKDTIFDVASVTKVVAGTPAIMILIERGKVKLDEPVHTYIPEFGASGDKAQITVSNLLTHTSGLPPDVSTRNKWQGAEAAIKLAADIPMQNPVGAKFVYSDINLFLVGEIVARVSGMPLNEFCAKEIYQPLKMVDTGFLPPKEKLARIAPTEKMDGVVLRGVVHDPTSRLMGGVAGHAGLFTTAADLARYCRMLLNLGELDGVRIMKSETVKMMTSVQTPSNIPSRRGFGWDIDSGFSRPRGDLFPIGSYGHTGFTGIALWIDPFSKTFFVFLCNRVHPDGKGNVLPLYSGIGTLAAESVTDFDFAMVTNGLPPMRHARDASAKKNEVNNDVPCVLNGIDVLARENFAPLKGLRIGLITNPTGRNCRRYPTIDLLRNAPDVQVKALFGPEHGIYGNFDEPVNDSVDERTGLPVYSLYGKRSEPTLDQLADIDALVFDIQDVGCRFYTYISTLGHCMNAANKAGIKFFVLDRVNPINGVTIDGPVLAGKTSFVGYHPIPLRYGMTEGELAQMFKAERHLDNLDLTVIKCEGWKRDQFFDQTAQPWMPPSPNMRSVTEAILYPGVGMLEYCQLSVGRNTGTPFEIIGAPYIHDIKLADELNKQNLPGVRFVPIRFTPPEYIFKNQSCAGVNIILTDREKCNVIDIGISIAKILNRWYPEQFEIKKMKRLIANPATLEAIEADKPLTEIKALWDKDRADFAARREHYLLYQ